MYGEQDCTVGPTFLKIARACLGYFFNFSGLAPQSISYAGNTAWAHIVASQTLKAKPYIGGQAFVITDDNRSATYADIAEPFFQARGYCISRFKIPFWFVYYVVSLIQVFFLVLLPVWRLRFPVQLSRRSLMHVKREMTFTGKKAREVLGYHPMYSYWQSIHRCLPYYKNMPL